MTPGGGREDTLTPFSDRTLVIGVCEIIDLSVYSIKRAQTLYTGSLYIQRILSEAVVSNKGKEKKFLGVTRLPEAKKWWRQNERYRVGRTETYGVGDSKVDCSARTQLLNCWSLSLYAWQPLFEQVNVLHRSSNLGKADGRCESNLRVTSSMSSIDLGVGTPDHTTTIQTPNFSQSSASSSDLITSTSRDPRYKKWFEATNLSSKCQ